MGIFVIAEIGSTHDGSFGNAKNMIDVVAECGADAVKFQMHIAEAETLASAPAPAYFKAEPRMQYFRRTGFSTEQWSELKAHAEEKKLVFLCSTFLEEAGDRLEELGITRYKVPSGEVTNLPLLEAIARTGKPVLLSSGMSSWSELDAAVEAILKRHKRLTVLQCSTEYPCPPEQVGLNLMSEMRDRYGLPVGLSDHTMSIYAPIAAATLGASAIEKHFTLSRSMYGSDARHSLEPHEFADMVRGIRTAEVMLSSKVDKDNISRFKDMKMIFEKSVVSVKDIPVGTQISRAMLGIKKPGTGIPARRIQEVVGKRAVRPIKAESLINWDDLS